MPFVGITHNDYQVEGSPKHQGLNAILSKYGSPGIYQGHFHGEYPIEQCPTVKSQVKLHEARTDHRLAALVHFQLFHIGTPGADQLADEQIG